MPVPQLVYRLVKGSALSAAETDDNFSTLAGFANGLENRIGVSLDSVGKLLPGAVTQDAIAAALAGLLDGVTIGFSSGSSAVSGQIVMSANPANNDTMTVTVNGTPIGITFVASSVGSNPGNVLIGVSAQATTQNLFGLLNNPNTTSSTQVAFSGPNAALISLGAYSIDGSVINISNLGSITSISVATTTSGNLWIPVVPGKIVVLPAASNATPSSGCVNLSASYVSATTWAVTADELVLKTGAGTPLLMTNINANANLATVGAGGMDTGSLNTLTWYYLWVISDGTHVNTLTSLSSTAPTLPTNYIYKALVGAAKTDGSSHLGSFLSRNRRMYIPETSAATAPQGSGNATGSAVVGPLGSSIIPPIAKVLLGNAGGTTGNNQNLGVELWGATNSGNPMGPAYCLFSAGSTGGIGLFGVAASYEIILDSTLTINWQRTGSSSGMTITITGYEF